MNVEMKQAEGNAAQVIAMLKALSVIESSLTDGDSAESDKQLYLLELEDRVFLQLTSLGVGNLLEALVFFHRLTATPLRRIGSLDN